MRPGRPKLEDIDGLATLLKQAKVDFVAEDMLDILWLADQMGEVLEQPVTPDQDRSGSRKTTNIREEILDDEETDEDDDQLPLTLPPSGSQDKAATAAEGFSLQAPAAKALRIGLELARALRPLRQKFDSPTEFVFDEAATLEQIADQRIWSPVLRPAPERWLEVALVVEDSPSLILWEKTIQEFQTLLERQGAFRRVTTWRLAQNEKTGLALYSNWKDQGKNQRSNSAKRKRPGRAKQLLDPAQRRLILLLSDCTSDAWHDGSILAWLKTWADQAPTAVVQFLPERLWPNTVLSQGEAVWLSSVERGAPSSNLNAQSRTPLLAQLIALSQAGGDGDAASKSNVSQRVKLPVVSLEAEPLKQWAKVVAGSGSSKTLGTRFDLAKLVAHQRPEPASLTPAERVQRFRTTASLMAQQLAGLMSVVPVDPAIVDLIRQTVLPKAEPVHVAEVYLGGLMDLVESEDEGSAQAAVGYCFPDGVWQLLADAVPKSRQRSVFDAVSAYISERLGLNTRSFEALVSLDLTGQPGAAAMVEPFAQVAARSLERMGEEGLALAERIRSGRGKVEPPPPVPDQNDLFPLLQTFPFREAILSFVDSLWERFEFETAFLKVQPPPVESAEWSSISTFLTQYLEEQAAEPLSEQSSEAEQTMLKTQQAIVAGAWNGETYNQIAARLPSYSPGFLKQEIAPLLWKRLSALVGTKVNKTNAKAKLVDWASQAQLTLTRQQLQGQQSREQLPEGVELEMVLIPAGAFEMGSPEDELGRSNSESPPHEVTLAEPFLLGKYPITQAQWRAVATLPQVERELNPNPSNFEGENRPVEQISWHDAVEFCARLSQHAGRPYRLPSEAEWEYACRAGTTTPFHFGPTITTDLANYRGTDWILGETTYPGNYADGPYGEFREETSNVGSFEVANGFGLYDLHGNVWEWCQDRWHGNYEGAPTDGSAWLTPAEGEEKEERVLRGGSWYNNPAYCRSATRGRVAPDVVDDSFGFRVACAVART